MPIQTGTHTLGPGDGTLTVNTYREGLAAKAGHDLIIEVRQWQATVTVADDPAQSRVELSAQPQSMHAREGVHGIKPLSDGDRREIAKNIQGKVLGSEPIDFRSTAVESADGGRLTVRGDLTMHGQTHPASFEVTMGDDGRVAGRAALTQSDWGIKPYRGMMGALKVRDALEVSFEGTLPAA